MSKLNKKGFTLIELLATIVLLGIIAVIAMVSIDKMLDNSQETECDSILLSIKNASKEYVSTNRFNLDKNPNLTIDASTNTITFKLNVNDLISDNFLSAPITNPFDKTKYEKNDQKLKDMEIHITLNDDYTYQQSNITTNTSYDGKIVNAIVTCDIDNSSVKEVAEKGKKYYYVRFPG